MKTFNCFILFLGILLTCSACSSPTEIAREKQLTCELEKARKEKQSLQLEINHLKKSLNAAKNQSSKLDDSIRDYHIEKASNPNHLGNKEWW